MNKGDTDEVWARLTLSGGRGIGTIWAHHKDGNAIEDGLLTQRNAEENMNTQESVFYAYIQTFTCIHTHTNIYCQCIYMYIHSIHGKRPTG